MAAQLSMPLRGKSLSREFTLEKLWKILNPEQFLQTGPGHWAGWFVRIQQDLETKKGGLLVVGVHLLLVFEVEKHGPTRTGGYIGH